MTETLHSGTFFAAGFNHSGMIAGFAFWSSHSQKVSKPPSQSLTGSVRPLFSTIDNRTETFFDQRCKQFVNWQNTRYVVPGPWIQHSRYRFCFRASNMSAMCDGIIIIFCTGALLNMNDIRQAFTCVSQTAAIHMYCVIYYAQLMWQHYPTGREINMCWWLMW